jgi:LytS/YehU family sensor histidine kinase
MQTNAFEQFWMYCTTLAIVLTFQYYQESRQRELREAELKSQVAEYELQILKLQLHPHFLFNTLNGISVLMMQDVKTAREMMLRLSDLLRMALAHTSTKEISLREEIDFIDTYLQIEQMRFGPRLRVSMQIDPATLDASVPNMILQPIVENAVRHGIGSSRAGGAIEIQAERKRDVLRITVSNDGTGLRPEPARRSGLGLGNTRARLLQLYGTAYNLRMAERESGRVEVCLEIPFREAEMPAHA